MIVAIMGVQPHDRFLACTAAWQLWPGSVPGGTTCAQLWRSWGLGGAAGPLRYDGRREWPRRGLAARDRGAGMHAVQRPVRGAVFGWHPGVMQLRLGEEGQPDDRPERDEEAGGGDPLPARRDPV